MEKKQVAEEVKAVQLPAVGSPLGGGFFAREVLIDGERYALIVAPKSSGEKFDLEHKLKERAIADGTDSEHDGLANSDKINDKNHPAAHFCRSLRIGDHDDWYLPSRDELMEIWLALGPNKKITPEIFRAGGAESFENRWYWSSTEHASYSGNAWYVNFSDGSQSYNGKLNNAGVRAVRRFKI